MQPVYSVDLEEAYRFARWMGGQLPSAKEWDTAAGFHLDADERGDFLGPYRLPENEGELPRVAVNMQPVPVDAETDDISPYGIRHMAGNGQEFTRTWSQTELPKDLDTLEENILVAMRGWSFRRFDRPGPLTYEYMEENNEGIPVGWGIQNQASSELSFRVVLEIPGK